MVKSTISATIEPSRALMNLINMSRSSLRPILDEATQAAGEVLQEEMRYRAPKHTGKGLEPDIKVKRIASGDLDSGVMVGPTSFPGARQREYGGVISAKNAPFLVWQDYDGNWHKAKSVYQEPTPYVRPAIAAKKAEATAKLASIVRKGFGL